MTDKTTPAAAASPAGESWHSQAASAALAQLQADPGHGLGQSVAQQRLLETGPNSLVQEKHEPWWEEAFESLTEPLQLLLIAVAAIYFWLGETEDAITILVVILTVAGIEVFSELRAKRAVSALSSLASPNATVIREGHCKSCYIP